MESLIHAAWLPLAKALPKTDPLASRSPSAAREELPEMLNHHISRCEHPKLARIAVKPLGITLVISNHPNTFPPISTSKYLSAFIRPIQVSNRTERLKPHRAAPNTPFAMDDPLTAHWAPLVNRASFTGREAEARPVIVLYNLSGSFQVISIRISLAGLSELRNGVKFGNRHNFNKYQHGVSSSQLVNPLVNQIIIEYLIHGLEFNKSNPTSTIERMTMGSSPPKSLLNPSL